MGFRTVVLLSNDMAHEWSKDPQLGMKIMDVHLNAGDELPGGIGQVVEICHADHQSLVMFDSLRGLPLAHGIWSRTEIVTDAKIKLLREAADRLGFRLVQKSSKQA